MKVWKKIQDIQKKAYQLRSQHLKELDAYKAKKAGTPTAVELNKLIHIEDF